jgi:hypothetical protein
MSGNSGWIRLLGRHAVEGAGVFDLQIVATMLANGVQRIYTFNPGDFQVFAGGAYASTFFVGMYAALVRLRSPLPSHGTLSIASSEASLR